MIRDAKILEAYLGELLYSLPDAGFLVNSAGRFVLVNALTEKMFGYDSGELTEGRGDHFRGAHPRSRGHVEAMASHRPYRPGLGVDAALAEIESNRGKLFDPAVVDACLRLFRVKGYQLPE